MSEQTTTSDALTSRLQEDGYPADVAQRIVHHNQQLLGMSLDAAAADVVNRYRFTGELEQYASAGKKGPSAAAQKYVGEARRQEATRGRFGVA